MIVVTGAAGFIGSCLIGKLNSEGFANIVAVDDFSRADKANNLVNKKIHARVNRDVFFEWAENNKIDFIFHIGARTDTTEFDWAIFDKLNLSYSKKIWEICTEKNIPLVYCSSAATYGNGECGYDDDETRLDSLKPLNPYGDSKHLFDLWVKKQEKQPPFWAGLKFFNVYGPNEFHKGRMASVIFHAFGQIKATGGMKLFRSHNEKFKDGEQLRDFIYVKDVIEICLFLMNEKPKSGIYNVGTGKAQTFLDLVRSTFKAMNVAENIEFIDIPADIRNTYQYFTEANMEKLRAVGYDKKFKNLEEGVEDYVKNYLLENKNY